MWKDAVRALETGTLGEIALIAFFTAFVLIVIYALTLPKKECEDALDLPLDDPTSIGGGRPVAVAAGCRDSRRLRADPPSTS